MALLIGIDAETAGALGPALEARGWSTLGIGSGAETLEQFGAVRPALAIVDFSLRDLPPIELTRQLRAACAQLRIVALIPGSMSDVVSAATRAGADPALVASDDLEELTRDVIALIARDASGTLPSLEPCDEQRLDFFSVYRSLFRRGPVMKKVEHAVFCMADTASPVLVRGERGAGKQAVARAIHYLSSRSQARWTTIDCSAMPPHVLDAQIFGRATDTSEGPRTRGALEEAHGGTLLLEEITQLPAETQAALVQFLQHGGADRADRPDRWDVRLITTTTENIEQLVANGLVREDLYRRIGQMTVSIPPLRDRTDEIPGLADFFRIRFMEQFRRDVPALSEPLLDLLRGYHWPGNVAELENVIKRYVVGGDEQQLTQELRGRAQRQDVGRPGGSDTLQAIGQQAALQAEMAVILDTLERVHWNRAEAARRLKVSYKTLLNKLRRAGITGRRVGRTFPRT